MNNRFKNFTLLIGKINRNIKRLKTEAMKEFNLKGPHVSCIYYLYTEGNLTASELVEMCDEDKAAISRTLDYLEQNGYIICDSKLKKRYRSPLFLTEKGRTVGKFIDYKINIILDEASKGLSEENRIILYNSLSLISDNLSILK